MYGAVRNGRLGPVNYTYKNSIQNFRYPYNPRMQPVTGGWLHNGRWCHPKRIRLISKHLPRSVASRLPTCIFFFLIISINPRFEIRY